MWITGKGQQENCDLMRGTLSATFKQHNRIKYEEKKIKVLLCDHTDFHPALFDVMVKKRFATWQTMNDVVENKLSK